MLDAFLVVAELEGTAARLVAQRILNDGLRSTQKANELCQKSVGTLDISRVNSANMTFHNEVIKAIKNRLLRNQLATASSVIFLFHQHLSALPGYMGKSLGGAL